jgi:hypothetical protein
MVLPAWGDDPPMNRNATVGNGRCMVQKWGTNGPTVQSSAKVNVGMGWGICFQPALQPIGGSWVPGFKNGTEPHTHRLNPNSD